MADDQERVRRLENTLTNGLQTLLSNPNSDTAPLAARLLRENVHVTQVSVRIGNAPLAPDEALKQRIPDWEQVIDLAKRASSHVPWKDFVFACSTKIDVSTGSKWMPEIARSIGGSAPLLIETYQSRDMAPTDWLEKVYALPDHAPTVEYRRNNFSSIAGELVAALRSAGKSSAWIANTITAVLRDFNGTKVERSRRDEHTASLTP